MCSLQRVLCRYTASFGMPSKQCDALLVLLLLMHAMTGRYTWLPERGWPGCRRDSSHIWQTVSHSWWVTHDPTKTAIIYAFIHIYILLSTSCSVCSYLDCSLHSANASICSSSRLLYICTQCVCYESAKIYSHSYFKRLTLSSGITTSYCQRVHSRASFIRKALHMCKRMNLCASLEKFISVRYANSTGCSCASLLYAHCTFEHICFSLQNYNYRCEWEHKSMAREGARTSKNSWHTISCRAVRWRAQGIHG